MTIDMHDAGELLECEDDVETFSQFPKTLALLAVAIRVLLDFLHVLYKIINLLYYSKNKHD
jgi:hypothetical protein